MRFLLDTHAFLWWILDDPALSHTARELIGDGGNEIFFSAVSAWEIATMSQRSQLALPGEPARFVAQQLTHNAFTGLPIQLSHALHVYRLPEHHRDPFDRLLVAQSQLEDLPILTADPDIARYAVTTVW